MTPQEKQLITALLARLKQAANQPKDPEAASLIDSAMAAQRDAPYLLVQTVLIQDMALADAQRRIAELEGQLAEAKAPPSQPTRFLGGAVPAVGPWGRSDPAPSPGPVWTQSGVAAPPSPAQPMMAPLIAPGPGSGFLRQAAATAAGVAGGALLFQGIESLFAPHYGSMFGGAPMQPGLSETVINNYYGDVAPDRSPYERSDDRDAGTGSGPDVAPADDRDFGNQNVSDQDGGQDWSGDDGPVDV
jgi:hypothetical protein